jgi:glutamine synthetase
MSEETNEFPTKWLNKLPEVIKDSVGSMSEDEIKDRIIEVEKGISQFEQDMEKDEKLAAAKQLVKELKETYTIPIKEHQIMIKFLVWNLEQRGK